MGSHEQICRQADNALVSESILDRLLQYTLSLFCACEDPCCKPFARAQPMSGANIQLQLHGVYHTGEFRPFPNLFFKCRAAPFSISL